ncbi:hypothetical protein [Nostoc punctiforme]|uniref:hypothetical protein n=1 Tax=Nostoc punctiforme TaxID=272131 RepID=UPI0018F02859|nr:hypothetical protein [Nostoc punctiforme]
MKSTKRPSKPPKQQAPAPTQPQSNPNSADNPTEQYLEHQPVSNLDELPQQHNEVAIADATTNPEQQSKPARALKPRTQKPELIEQFQHIKFLDCNKPVGRVIFECWHCQQGIISESRGEPIMGEFKGRPSITLVNVECPNCGKTAIKLSTAEVLSTTAIPSPWKK